MSQQHPIGIIGALPEEIAKLKAHVQNQVATKHGNFCEVTRGVLHGKDVVFASAGVGMVFASITATIMVETYKVRAVIFTGVAGALSPALNIGDIVVGADVVNYDMDVTAFKLPWDASYVHKRGEVPFVNLLEYPGDSELVELAMNAPVKEGLRRVTGRIATGSEFLTSDRKKELSPVWKAVGDPIAVEMECAGVAQVCRSFGKPFLGLRAISDAVEGDANNDFNAFVQVAADNLWSIVDHVVSKM